MYSTDGLKNQQSLPGQLLKYITYDLCEGEIFCKTLYAESHSISTTLICISNMCYLSWIYNQSFSHKIANLISKLNFYKLIPYPMDNCFTGRCDRSRKTTEKAVLYKLWAGPVMECTFTRWRTVLPSCLDMLTSSHLFRSLNLVSLVS